MDARHVQTNQIYGYAGALPDTHSFRRPAAWLNSVKPSFLRRGLYRARRPGPVQPAPASFAHPARGRQVVVSSGWASK